jgi:phage shock protein PspC (stress-responsive transcriptional regulator)
MNNQESLRINRAERRFLGVCAGLADYLDVPVLLVRVIFVITVLTWPTLIIGYFLLYFCLDNNITTEKVQQFFSSGGADHFRKLDYRRPIYRNLNNRRIAGVCSGIADFLEVSTFWVRAVAILMTLILGPYAVLAYVIGWVVMEPNIATPKLGWRERKQARREARRERYNKRHRRAARHLHPTEESLYTDRMSDEYRAGITPAPSSGADRKYSSRDTLAEPVAEPRTKSRTAAFTVSLDECAEVYYRLENRLRDIEAFITSKRFRLHCEINRA